MKKNGKKRRLKLWTIYAIASVLMYILMDLCVKFELVYIVNSDTLDITKIVVLIGVWELLKKAIKIIVKRTDINE